MEFMPFRHAENIERCLEAQSAYQGVQFIYRLKPVYELALVIGYDFLVIWNRTVTRLAALQRYYEPCHQQ